MSMPTRSAERASRGRARWRSALAVGVVAGLATIGMTALAAPAAAEELTPPAVEELTPPAEESAADESAAAPSADDSAAPADTGDPAAPEDSSTAPADAAAPAATTEEPSTFAVALLAPPGEEVVDKVEICHATASYKNPYIINEPAADGDVSGHADHTGPIFWPDIPKHTAWGDIIPPFFYEGPGGVEFFPGLNWTAEGAAIYADDCEVPLPELDVTVMPGDCSTGDDGTVSALFSGLIVDEEYSYYVEGPDYLVADTFIAGASSEEVVLTDLPPGNFIVYIEWVQGEFGPIFDWRGFVIEPCQPEITVEVTECPAPGGAGSVLLTLSNLVDGVEYNVTVTDRGDADGTPYGGVHTVTGDDAGTAQVLVAPLPADTDYTAWVDGLWEAVPWEEPPFVGGGGFVPIESAELTTHVDFSLKPCPAAPPLKPVTPVTPTALAATGADGIGGLLVGSMLLLGLGAAMLVARRRWTDAHDLN